MLLVALLFAPWPAAATDPIFLLHDKGLDRHGGYDESPHLYRMQLQANDVVVLNRYRTRYGERNVGAKQREGDHRTPEGKYSITDIQQRSQSERASFGPWSLRISYPNKYDWSRPNPGGDILIHGGHNAITDGCIRVLDDGYRSFGSKNITELAHNTDLYTPILSASHVPRQLKGRPGKRLGAAAAAFYRALLTRDLDNETVVAYVKNFPRDTKVGRSARSSSRRQRDRQTTPPRVTARASSELHQIFGPDCLAANVLDGRADTAWCEGVSGDGIGQWIEIDLGHETVVQGFKIVNGYDKEGRFDRWEANGRLAKVEITTDTGHSYTATFEDDRKSHRWTFDGAGIRAHTVRFTIRSVFRGSRYHDTCISTLRLIHGSPGS